jgi:polysaccharide biosynthesis/export protein
MMIRFLVLLGALLFSGVAQAQGSYLIKPGDILRVEVLEDSSMNRNALVLPDGTISLPQAGVINAAGKTVGTLQAEITGLLTPSFAAEPSVFIGVDNIAQRERTASTSSPAVRTISIYLMGEAAKPGKLEVKSGSTLLQVLAEAGGFTKFAAVKRIQIRRGSTIYTVNYKAIEAGTDPAAQMVMKSGDVIVAPQRRLFE